MSPSVRVKRRHAYTSIRDDETANPEHEQDQIERGRRRVISDSGPVPPNAPSSSTAQATSVPPPVPPVPPHDTTQLSPNHPSLRWDMGRVNRLARASSFSYRSFSADQGSNLSNSPPPTVAQLSSIPPPAGTIYEGASAEVVVPGPRQGHTHKTSRVQSALSSSPSHGDKDSESDSDYDSEDEDRIMEDDEHHHDDDVVDHLDVIGPWSRVF